MEGKVPPGVLGERFRPSQRDVLRASRVAPPARHLLAVDVAVAASVGANLLKLAVDGLPVNVDAGIADNGHGRYNPGSVLSPVIPGERKLVSSGSAFLKRSLTVACSVSVCAAPQMSISDTRGQTARPLSTKVLRLRGDRLKVVTGLRRY
jgi:hypothetical protein